MADSPSHEWDDDEPGPRILKRRAVDTREGGEARGGHTVVTGTDRYKTPEPNGHRLTRDPDVKDTKAVSSKKAQNKSVKSSASK